jgi:methylthioribose-1-phosphate isomerase
MRDLADVAPGIDLISPLRWERGVLSLIDQRLLPTEERWIDYRDHREVARAIVDMVVRGAPAIGITAAYGVVLGALAGARLDEVFETLRRTRPTAVNLFWALERMRRVASEDPSPERLEREAIAIHVEDVQACLAIGRLGGPLLPAGTVLTHCNAGALATGGYGTALGVIRGAFSGGTKLQVLVDETRPFLQGARLTAWELMRSAIPATLITDNMAGFLMSRGEVQSVVVGADRIAANGDTANKIGTYAVAVLAREHGIPFFVAAPRSTIDRAIPDGSHIPIEERAATEVTTIGGRRVAPEGMRVRNPAFDVTPARLIAGIITEAGVARPPYEASIAGLFVP